MIEIVKTNNQDSIDTFCAKLSTQMFAREFLNFKDSESESNSSRITAAKVNAMATKIYAWAESDSKKEFDKKLNALHFSFDLMKDNANRQITQKRATFAALTSGASKLLSFAEEL